MGVGRGRIAMKRIWKSAGVAALCLLLPGVVRADNLVTNSDFTSGLSGWTLGASGTYGSLEASTGLIIPIFKADRSGRFLERNQPGELLEC